MNNTGSFHFKLFNLVRWGGRRIKHFGASFGKVGNRHLAFASLHGLPCPCPSLSFGYPGLNNSKVTGLRGQTISQLLTIT